MSLSAEILKTVILPLSGSKAMMADPSRLEAAALKSQSAGAAPPGLLLRRGVQVLESNETGTRCFHCFPEGDSAPVRVLYVHGGAYALELTSYHWSIITDLVRRCGTPFHVPVFPLAPRHTWREAMDALLAIQAVLVQQDGPLVLMGDSSGAALALSLAQELRARGDKGVDALILLSPALDYTFSAPESAEIAPHDPLLSPAGPRWAATAFSPSGDAADPAVSPLFGDFRGLPSLHLFGGTLDLTSPDAARAHERAQEAGARSFLRLYDDMPHVFMSASIPEAEECLGEIARVLGEVERHGRI